MMGTIYRIEKKKILSMIEVAVFIVMALPFISILLYKGQFEINFVLPGPSSSMLESIAAFIKLLIPFAAAIPVIRRKPDLLSIAIVCIGLSDLLYSLSFFMRAGTMSYFAWSVLFDLIMLLIYMLTIIEFFDTNTMLFTLVIGITLATGILFIGYLISVDFMNITYMMRTVIDYLIIAAITIEMSDENGHFENGISHGEFMGIEKINTTN